MKGRLKFSLLTKDKKEARLTIKLDLSDIQALERGMGIVGETNMSSYVRRLIHEGAKRL
jgi:hypothetical protein